MRNVVVAVLLVVAGMAAALAGPEATHTGVVKSARLEVRYRPGARSGAYAERVAAAAERDLDRIAAALETKPKGPFLLYLYDDLQDIVASTGVTGTGGFSAGNASHVPYDNDQTRLHEMVHIVAYEWPKSGEEPRNLFFAEGIANAVLGYVHGVSVHAVAAWYAKRDRLPPLAEMAGAQDFYAWQRAHPAFNAYDVAASWMRFLIDKHGIAKVKRYYTGTPAGKAFGAELLALEKGWREMLAKFPMRPEVETLLSERAGEGPGFAGLPADIAGTPSDWTSLMAADLKPVGPATWERKGEAIVGSNGTEQWGAIEFGTDRYGDCAVRARIKTPVPCPIQVRLGPGNQVMIVNGVFLYRGEQPVRSSAKAQMNAARHETDLVVARRGITIDVWVDGAMVLSAPAAAGPDPVGVGLNFGTATFEDVRVRRLP